MCLKCHLKLSDNDILQSLEDNHNNYEFTKWNYTSISHLKMSSSGFNGPKNRYIYIY